MDNIALKAVLGLVYFAAVVGLSIAVMIFGWGLEPQSWGWILGGNFVIIVLAAFIGAVSS